MVNKDDMTHLLALALSANAAPAQRPAMNAVDVASIVAMTAMVTLMNHETVVEVDGQVITKADVKEALDRLARLVAVVADVYGESCDDQCPLGCPSYRICKALAAVLGEGE